MRPAHYLYPYVRHVCVTEPRPLVGPTGRGKASTDPANEEPEDKGREGVSRRSRLLTLLRPEVAPSDPRAAAPCLITGPVAENADHLPEALDSVPSTSEDGPASAQFQLQEVEAGGHEDFESACNTWDPVSNKNSKHLCIGKRNCTY